MSNMHEKHSTVKGKFITIEGSEGVGKSTNIVFIQTLLARHAIDLVLTREPGGTPFAEELRALLLQERSEHIDEMAELLLVFAARAQHLQQVILPALDAGQWVLCDRFVDSTYAYQGGGRGLDVAMIRQLEQSVLRGLMPDLTLYLDIDVKEGLARASARAQLDRFESEQIEFFERVRASYLQRVDTAEHYRVIDASQALDSVQDDITSVLRPLIVQYTEM